MKVKLRKAMALALCLCTVLTFCACAGRKAETVKIYDSLQSMEGISAGVCVGSIFDGLTLEVIPTAEIKYYQSPAECIGALLEGKVDLTINEGSSALLSVSQNPSLTVLPYELNAYQYGAIFKKDEEGYALCDDFNRFLEENWTSEALTELFESWMSDKESKEFDYEALPATNGSITVATDSVYFPLTFIRNGKHTGFEVELIYNYCKSRGYALKFDVYDFGGVLAAVSAGKAELGMSSIIMTEERMKSYCFSEPYANGVALFIIRKENAPGEYNSLRELDGKTLGVMAGTGAELAFGSKLTDPNLQYLDSASDLLRALRDGTIDAGILSELRFDKELGEDYGLVSIDSVGKEELAYALSDTEKGNALKKELDAFLSGLKESGELTVFEGKWLSEDGVKDVNAEELEGQNGTIRMAVSTTAGKPCCYNDNGKILGLDVDLIVAFSKAYGYDVEIWDYASPDLLPALREGKCDIAASSVIGTEQLLFTEPYYESTLLLIVRAQSDDAEALNFFEQTKQRIHRTLIEEGRYRLFLNGLAMTCFIAGASAVFGFALACLLFILSRRRRKATDFLLRAYTWIVDALPVVVLLMIFYYVIFGSSRISGVWVSVIAFSVLFSVSVFGLMKTCFASVDIGQFEAAYALGYSKRETVKSIILPQLLPMFLSPFKSELTGLFKSTSVVGYIAVQDLTKVSDIIRSKTYEAFFPLVITTVIYFVITALFGLLTKLLEKRFARARDIEQFLKGVRGDD